MCTPSGGPAGGLVLSAPRISLAPLLQPVRCRLGIARDLEAAATEIQVVAEEERAARPAAVFLPSQPERIRAVQPESTPARERERIEGGPVLHAATLAIRLRDAVYMRGVLYAGGTRLGQSARPSRPLPGRIEEEVVSCALPSSIVGNRYFGHFVTDDLVRGMLAEGFAPARFSREDRFARWPHARFYAGLCGPSGPEIWRARIREAWVFRDHGMTSDRRRRLALLGARLRAGGGVRSGHGVFLRRGGSGAARRLVNEAEIEARLAREGFEILDPATMEAAEIARRACAAAVVCGVEGSALVHGVLAMVPGGALLTLQHPYQVTHLWKDFTDALGLGYGFVVGEGTPEAFAISPDDILRTLDRLLGAGS